MLSIRYCELTDKPDPVPLSSGNKGAKLFAVLSKDHINTTPTVKVIIFSPDDKRSHSPAIQQLCKLNAWPEGDERFSLEQDVDNTAFVAWTKNMRKITKPTTEAYEIARRLTSLQRLPIIPFSSLLSGRRTPVDEAEVSVLSPLWNPRGCIPLLCSSRTAACLWCRDPSGRRTRAC